MNKLFLIGNSFVRLLFLFINIDYKEIICVLCFKNVIMYVNYVFEKWLQNYENFIFLIIYMINDKYKKLLLYDVVIKIIYI